MQFFLHINIEMKNRGMLLETLLNQTIIFYEENNLALFHKKHIDLRFSKLTKQKNQITTNKAWIMSKSTVDYYGSYQGFFVAFEAKSTHSDKLYIKNIKAHQRKYIQKVLKLAGIAFYIFGFVSFNEFFLVTEKIIEETKKSFLKIQEVRQKGFLIDLKYPGILDFLPLLKKICKKIPY